MGYQFNPEISVDKMNQFTPSTIIAALLCAFAVGTTAQGQEVHGYWKSGHDHFYTTDMTEIGVINVGLTGNHGYKYEGVGFRVLANQEEGTTALNRYWHADSTNHFYTTNLKEMADAVGKYGYTREGTLGF